MDATVEPRGPAARLRFGPFLLDLDRAELHRDGALLALRPKAFALLSYLARHPQRALSKDELLGAVWPDVVVTDDSISQCVGELRAALGDRDGSLIKTVPRRGYLFDTAVRTDVAAPAAAASDATPPPVAAPQARRHWPWAAAALVLVALSTTGWMLQRPSAPARIDAAIAERRSIAVMPFADLSDPPAPHVAQAVDMDLTTDLGRLANTRVMARASAAALGSSANVDLKRVGRELDVRHVVTGSVKRDGERLHVTVQLARTDTGALLWSERFDFASAADWTVQRAVLARIANVLDARVQGAALEAASKAPPSDAAVDHWMRGAYLLSRFRTQADLLQARAAFEAALAAQPDSGQALAGIARTHVREVISRWSADRKASLETAERLARRALDIDPQDQAAMGALSGALTFNGRLDEAMIVARRHVAANPNDANAQRDIAAVLYFQGRWEENLRQLEIALRLNPLDSHHVWVVHSMAAISLIALRRYDEAVEHARQIEAPGDRRNHHASLAAAEALRGNLDAGRRHAAELLKINPNSTIAGLRASRGSTAPAFLAGQEHFFDGLRLAGVPEAKVAAR